MDRFSELFILRNHPPLPRDTPSMVVHARWVHGLLFKNEQCHSASRSLMIVRDMTITDELLFPIELRMASHHDAVLHGHRADGQRSPDVSEWQGCIRHNILLNQATTLYI